MSHKLRDNSEEEREGKARTAFIKNKYKVLVFTIGMILIAVLFVGALLVIPDAISKNNYEKGVQAIIQGDYQEALKYLEKSNLNDAAEQLEHMLHQKNANKAYEDKDYKMAYDQLLLIHESYPAYNEVLELKKKTSEKISQSLLREAEDFFEKGYYIDAYDYLNQALMYSEDYEEALLLRDYYKENAQVMEAEKSENGYFLVDGNSIRQRKYVNIPKWHDAGYKGKGLTILHDDIGNTMHSLNCLDIIQTILPDARIIRGLISGKTNSKGVEESSVTYYDSGRTTMLFDEFIVKYDISMINNSKTGGNGNSNSKWSAWMKNKIKEYNLITFGSAGNSGDIDNRFYGSFIMVSGVYLKEDGSILNYGAKGDIDFSMFMGFQSGTSSASPFLCGMAGLLKSKYPEISQEEVYEYFKNHSQKLGNEGKNTDYGWGLPILGDPEDFVF